MSIRFDSNTDKLYADGGYSIENGTAMCWLKRYGDTDTWSGFLVFVQGNGQQLRWVGTASDGVVIEIYDGNITHQYGGVWPTEWTHYAITYTPTNMKLYVNGSLVDTLVGTPVGNTAETLHILGSNFDEWGNGEVQDVRVWQGELTGPQILAEYQSTSPVLLDNFAHHWPLVTSSDLTDHYGSRNLTSEGTPSDGTSQPPGYASEPIPPTYQQITSGFLLF